MNETGTMIRQKRIIVVLISVFVGGSLAGCTPVADSGDNGSSDVELPDGVTAPQAFDVEILEETSDEYVTLRETQTAIEARNTLVDALNAGTTGVSSAGLANDNYTIVLAFEDGSHAALNTIEGFGNGDVYDSQAMAGKIAAALREPELAGRSSTSLTDPDALKGPEPGDLKHTPTSRKILFMSAISEDLNGADMDLFESLTTKLVIENNWSTSDITIKTNQAEDGYATLGFDDFFDLEDYGVIVIIAHGLYMDTTRRTGSSTDDGSDDGGTTDGDGTDSSDPFNFGFKTVATAGDDGQTPHYFIQVAAAGPMVSAVASPTSPPDDDKSDPFDFGFKRMVAAAETDGIDLELETAGGRLLIVSHASPDTATIRPYYYMRDDLWKENIGTLPNSLIYLASPSGYADPDETWPDVGADDDAADSADDDTDPFNFGFKRIDRSSFKTADSGAGLIFEGTDAGTVLAWTGAVDTQAALDAAWLMALMAGRNESDREVWNSGDIRRAAAKAGVPRRSGVSPPDPGTADGSDPYGFGFKGILRDTSTAADESGEYYAKLALHSKTEDAFLYLPTWAEITALDPIPDGTATLAVEVDYTSADNPVLDPSSFSGDVDETFTFDGLIPGQEVTVVVQALDSAGALVSEFEETLTLQSGGNDIEASFTRELSVTLSGSDDDSGDWGDREDLENPHRIHCEGYRIRVSKNGELLSPNSINLTQLWVTQTYPPIQLISHDEILTYSGWNPAYPGDTISVEFTVDANDGISASIGPMYLHYWNDATHEVIELDTVFGSDGEEFTQTVTLGK